MKILNPRLHGYLDYALAAAFVLAPILLDMSRGVALLCYAIATTHVVMTLLTAFPLGAVDLLSFRTHGWIELFASVGLAAAPWVFGFAGEAWARTFFLAAGGVLFVVWMLTDYKQESYTDKTGHVHRPRYAQHLGS